MTEEATVMAYQIRGCGKMVTRSGAGAASTARLLTPGVTLMRPQRTTPSVALRTCGQCGRSFLPDHGNVSRGYGRFCSADCYHAFRCRDDVIVSRFWSRVDKDGPIPSHCRELGPCWLWKGGLGAGGYGSLSVRGRGVRAHRYSFELEHGAIDVALQLDHLCRTRACVRPSHLDPVTARENIIRGVNHVAENARMTHCRRGHEFTEANTYLFRGARNCRTCRKESGRRFAEKGRTRG